MVFDILVDYLRLLRVLSAVYLNQARMTSCPQLRKVTLLAL